MMRPLGLALGLVLLATSTRADDIPAETVDAVKKATVFVRVQGTGWKGSGSGFVVARDKDSVLVATNYHVIVGPDFEKKVKSTPSELVKSLKAPTITGVFDGGTKTELSSKAEAIAADPEADLAILRISGLKDPPTPIDLAANPKLSETMSVYTFGFPFGQALATGKGAPAITVGKGSISSLRNDDNGDLSVVQIDGSLNPGNSGGPVVDAKGKLVGVAVATVKNGQGIGFAVPAAELTKLMKGRLGGFHLTASKAADGKLTVKAEVAVLDPAAAVRGVTLHYVVADAKAKKLDRKELVEKQAGAKKITLKVEGGLATGELTLESAEGVLFVQVVPDGGLGAAGISAVREFGLVVPKGATGAVALGAPGTGSSGPAEGAKPPAGWKEHAPRDNSFGVWIPEKVKSQSERERTSVVSGQRLKFNLLVIEATDGQMFVIEEVIVPVALARKLKREELEDAFRDVLVSELGGKVTDDADVKMGQTPGKEYRIQAAKAQTRARVFVAGNRVLVLRATGTKEQVDGENAKILLESVRVPGPGRPEVAVGPGPGPGPAPANPGQPRGPRLLGGAADPEFRDIAPEGGLLVGFEVGLGKFVNNDVMKAVRPIYRIGDKDTPGQQFGTETKNLVTVLAKPGYAVGAITVKAGLGIDGLSITFMKVVDGKLDSKDNYESDWVGGMGGGRPTKIGGDGTPVVGIIGKANAKDATGLGLAYKGDKPFPPGKPTQIQGGVFDGEFRDGAPAGGVLVGFEVGLGKFINNDVVKAVRPIYRVGDKDSLGEQYGTELTRVVKVVAKPGYAVGAINIKTALGVDGFSILFRKVVDGKLDPKDNYEGEWVGGMGGGGIVRIGGDGTLVIGACGKANAKDVTGLGLLLKEADKK